MKSALLDKNYQIFDRQWPHVHYYLFLPLFTICLLIVDFSFLNPEWANIAYVDKLQLACWAVLFHLVFYCYVRFWSPRYAELRPQGILFASFFNAIFVKYEDVRSLGLEDAMKWEDVMYDDFERKNQLLRIYFKKKTPLGQSALVILKLKPVKHFGTTFFSDDFLMKLVNRSLSFYP